MCTLIVLKGLYANYPLVVAANRDELLDRPSETPQIREKHSILAGAILCKETEHWEGYTMRSYTYNHAHDSCWAVFGGKPK